MQKKRRLLCAQGGVCCAGETSEAEFILALKIKRMLQMISLHLSSSRCKSRGKPAFVFPAESTSGKLRFSSVSTGGSSAAGRGQLLTDQRLRVKAAPAPAPVNSDKAPYRCSI